MSTIEEIGSTLSAAIRAIEAPKLDFSVALAKLEGAKESVTALGDVLFVAAGANSMDGAMSGAIRVVLQADATADAMSAVAAEVAQYAKAFAAIGEQAREHLAAALLECGDPGAHTAETGTHLGYLTNGRPSVKITDPAKLPHNMWRTKDPEPNKAAILALLKAGQAVPGAEIVPGSPSLTITPKKETRA